MAKKKSNKRIIAIFKDEQVVLDYTKVRDKIGLNDFGYVNCAGKYRIYGGDRTCYNVETIQLHKSGVINSSIEIEYIGDDNKVHSMISDIILVLEDENCSAVFFLHGTANSNVYDNTNIGDKF